MTGERRLAVLFAGFGGLATSCMAKCLLARRGGAIQPALASLPFDESESRAAADLRAYLTLTPITDLVFGGWDVFLENAAVRIATDDTLGQEEVGPAMPELSSIKPMRAVFYREYPVGVFGTFNKRLPTKSAMVGALVDDIKGFLASHGAARAVAVWCGSPEQVPPPAVHETIDAFNRGLDRNDASITNSQIYSWASVAAGVPFLSVEPNGCVLFPAIRQFAGEQSVPLAGEGFPTLPPPIDPDQATEADHLARRKAIEATIPLLLDSILLLDAAHRRGWAGLQDWLAIYFSAAEAGAAERKQRYLEALAGLAR